MAFHTSFCATQSLAAHLATAFNTKLRGLPNYSGITTPNVCFLKCSVLVLKDPQWPQGERGVLVEKQLDTERFQWRKWNNNAGAVYGKMSHRPMDVDYELAKLERTTLRNACLDDMIIEEGSEEDENSNDSNISDNDDEEEEDDDDDDDDSYEYHDSISSTDFQLSDYLQAFSHFTYLFTNRKLLVCDLQGVYNTDLSPPTFELSDPVIHYRSKKGRNMVFGRTDKGQKGIQLFFNSHVCTGICKILELSKKNTKWRKQWLRDFKIDSTTSFTSI